MGKVPQSALKRGTFCMNMSRAAGGFFGGFRGRRCPHRPGRTHEKTKSAVNAKIRRVSSDFRPREPSKPPRKTFDQNTYFLTKWTLGLPSGHPEPRFYTPRMPPDQSQLNPQTIWGSKVFGPQDHLIDPYDQPIMTPS